MIKHSTYTPPGPLYKSWALEASCDYLDCNLCIACFEALQVKWQFAKVAASAEGCWAYHLMLEKCGAALVAKFGGTYE